MRKIFLLAISFSFAIQAQAQWVKIAPNLLPPVNYAPSAADGAICFKDGILWAGAHDQLFSSADFGKTWTKSNFSSYFVLDINFFDKFTGLVATGGDIFLTHDGGQTWKTIFWHVNSCQVSFNHSPDIIHVHTIEHRTDFNLFTSLDGGLSWSKSPHLASVSVSFAIGLDRTIYVHSDNDDIINENGWINFSTDLGKTWSPNMSRTDGDCYAIAADSCDSDRLYLANEEWVDVENDSSEVFLTTNRGTSWKTVFSHQRQYLSGTFATTRNVIYTGCVSPYGILRSTDRGLTWKDIGGPSVAGDSHSIAVADDYTVFALDEEGSVWRTTNSGGDSLKDFPKVSLTTENVSADTIGQNELQIPIKFENLGEERDVDCILHYNFPLFLHYNGSFSSSGVPLDVAGQQWAGRSKLHVPNASSAESIFGYARFTLIADSSIVPKVWFDSLEVFNAIIPCAIYDQFVSSGNKVESIITMHSGCGSAMISDFLRTGKILDITSIRPNPAQDEIEINLVSAIKQNANIEIRSSLGIYVHSETKNLVSGPNSIHIDIRGFASGMYLVKVGELSQSLLINR